jgi:sporulation and spore germination protein
MKEKSMENQRRSCNVQHTPLRLRSGFFLITALLLVTTVFFSACAAQNTETTNVPTTSKDISSPTASQDTGNHSPTVVPSATANGGYSVKVYFSKVNSPNYNDVVAKDRTSPTSEVETFAIEQLVAGPTQAEQNQGLFSQLHNSIKGPSNCAGHNFLLTPNKKGKVNEQGTATLQFCRDIDSPGIGSDARIKAEVSTTLEQFSTIKKVVILLKSGHCLGDESGMDMCLT